MEEHQDNFSLLFNPQKSNPNKEVSINDPFLSEYAKLLDSNKGYFEELTPIKSKRGFQSIQIPNSCNNEGSLGTDLILNNYRRAAQQATLLISELKATIEYKKNLIFLAQVKDI